MGDSKSARSLHQLLDSVLVLQRQDIHAFSGGHLNESNLYKPEAQKAIEAGRWKSSQPRKLPPVSHLVEAEGRHRDQLVTMTQDQMKGVLKEFSVDTPLKVPKPTPVKRDGVSEVPVMVGRSLRHVEGGVGAYLWMDDGVLVEEVQVSDLSVPKLTPRTQCVFQQPQAHTNRQQQQFMPSYLEGITKKDQFKLMKKFEREVLGLDESKVQNIFTGHAAVEHAESHLEEGLSSLQLNGAGPNFHKLQVYSDTFDCLIKTSPTFGYLLQTIKNKYDDFVGELLDSQSGKHQVLLDHMKQLSDGGTSNTKQLHNDISVVTRMEEEAKKLLEENERLRREVEEEIKLAAEPTPEPQERTPCYENEPVHDLSDQIEGLNAAILEKYDTLQQLRVQMRTEFVPATVCTHLEQCIKETEVEVQKLNSMKDYFIRSVGEMEKKLTETIEQADTTEKDARRIWKKIEAKKPLEVPDDAEDEESKWSWYIS